MTGEALKRYICDDTQSKQKTPWWIGTAGVGTGGCF